MDCLFCKQRAPEGAVAHGVCSAEWRRRVDAGMCVSCGAEAECNGCYCGACDAAAMPVYHGYPVRPCDFCDMPVHGGARFHDACNAEFDRRDDAGLCGLCGELPREPDFWQCSACSGSKPWVFRGYPGSGHEMRVLQ